MISVAQAQARLSQVRGIKQTERVTILEALGRVCSQDIKSSLDIPPNYNSAMDGFAINTASLNDDATSLPISQRIAAGDKAQALKPGSAARIFTGAMMPEGSDAVVIQENCEYSDNKVTIRKAVAANANIRPQGQDIQKGAVVITKGQKINAIDISLLASIGVTSINVFRPVTVALFSTGNELVEPGNTLQAGQIYNSNRPLLIALCHKLGFKVHDCGIVEDTLEATKQALLKAASCADVIISSGGVSVGEEDHVKPAVEALGHLELWKVQMKPGKPVAYGHINNTPFLGLPGNPVSSFTVFQLLGLPLLTSLQSGQWQEPYHYPVTANFEKKLSTREDYIRVKLLINESRELCADCFPNLSSGVMSSLSWADGLVRQAVDTSITYGDKVDFFPLHEAIL